MAANEQVAPLPIVAPPLVFIGGNGPALIPADVNTWGLRFTLPAGATFDGIERGVTRDGVVDAVYYTLPETQEPVPDHVVGPLGT